MADCENPDTTDVATRAPALNGLSPSSSQTLELIDRFGRPAEERGNRLTFPFGAVRTRQFPVRSRGSFRSGPDVFTVSKVPIANEGPAFPQTIADTNANGHWDAYGALFRTRLWVGAAGTARVAPFVAASDTGSGRGPYLWL